MKKHALTSTSSYCTIFNEGKSPLYLFMSECYHMKNTWIFFTYRPAGEFPFAMLGKLSLPNTSINSLRPITITNEATSLPPTYFSRPIMSLILFIPLAISPLFDICSMVEYIYTLKSCFSLSRLSICLAKYQKPSSDCERCRWAASPVNFALMGVIDLLQVGKGRKFGSSGKKVASEL